MNINVEVKIKMDKGTELILKNDEAKELYLKLKELYEKETTWVPLPYYPVQPYIWEPYKVWYSSDNTYSVSSSLCPTGKI